MTKEFRRPLARKAKIWPARTREGMEQTLLIVVTTLELDAKHEAYSKRHVDRLAAAVEEFVANAPGVSGFALVNRPKDWEA